MENATTIQVNKDQRKRIRIIAALTDKKMNEVIEESLDYLERKYNITRSTEEENEIENINN